MTIEESLARIEQTQNLSEICEFLAGGGRVDVLPSEPEPVKETAKPGALTLDEFFAGYVEELKNRG